MASKLLDQLGRRVLVLDGAMGTSIHNHDLDVENDYWGCENCTDVLALSRPDVIQGIHESFLAAGADAVETDTFGGARHVLREFDLQDKVHELNKAAAEIARAACEKFATSDKPRFVIGSMGPGTKLLTLGQIDWAAMHASYRDQAAGLIAGGADALIVETCQDLLQVKCAINAAIAAIENAKRGVDDIPLMVSVTIEQTGTMLLGSSIEAAATALARYPIASLGLNCATGPTEMGEHLKYLAKNWRRPITVFPNAGLPVLVDGRAEFPLGAEPFAAEMLKFVEKDGVALVGGCCGTTPEHIARLAEAVGDRAPATIDKTTPKPACTSLYSVQEYRQETSFLIIGERCNASGSRAFKKLLEDEDWDGIVSLAREQVRDGSHVLDVNVDYAGRDNARDMAEVVTRLVRQVDVPLMLDSTQVATLRAGLEHAGGKCLINSANFEDGEEKFDTLCELATTFGAGLVIGSIDEDKEAAMARTAVRKHAIAKRAFERATQKHGIPPADILFDPLVLPISTGMDEDRRSALALIEGVRLIARDLPECQITCGLSNVSFGLKPAARQVLNSAFLHELVEAGLTSAIVHASKILPRNKIDDEHWDAALNLVYDRRHESRGGTGLPPGVSDEDYDPLQSLIDLFKDVTTAAETRVSLADLPLEERLQRHIIDGEKQNLTASLDEAMQKYSPLDIINDHLLEGMKVVGELFGSGQMQLPFVLQSAEVMKTAVAHLEPHMEKVSGQTKGTIVLATVKGDVHDIGKNLVDIILSNNGYTVHNIGIKQPLPNILAKWRETNADAIGLSGLLVKSVTVMAENLKEMAEAKLDVPVILGGAALSRHYCERHLRMQYTGPCLYGKDAFEGLRLMDRIMTGRLAEVNAEVEERLAKRSAAEQVVARSRAEQAERQQTFEDTKQAGVAIATRSDVATDVTIPRPPFWGTRVVADLDLDEIYPFVNQVALFRGQWQLKRGSKSKDDYEDYLDDTARPVFERLKQQCRDEAILQPKVVYAYFPVQSDGNDLIIYDPSALSSSLRDDPTASSPALAGEVSASLRDDGGGPGSSSASHLTELTRFTFPRQNAKRHLCISDFFRSRDSGDLDVLGMTCVTMGPEVTRRAKTLFDNNDYTEYLYLHGMGVECAEALAELWHKRMRQELGIAGDDAPKVRDLFTQHYRGSRYSFGYPACPDMSDQEILWRLLAPERIGCTLTENWQIDPEQSTSAIIVHHPEAKYFNV
jgi:5-methyltetrahydrofolate--homocysteine methyltransferase